MFDRSPDDAVEDNKNSIQFALLMGFVAIVATVTLVNVGSVTRQQQANLFAERIDTVSVQNNMPSLLTAAWRERDCSVLASLLDGVRDSGELLATCAELTVVREPRVTMTEAGLLMSLSGGTGDSLHPYYGLLSTVENRLYWGGDVIARVLLREFDTGDAQNLIVRNESHLPWLLDDVWVDTGTGQQIKILAREAEQVTILPQADAVFLLPAGAEEIVNVTRGFALQISE